MNRRRFLITNATAFAGATASHLCAAPTGDAARAPRILLRPGTFQIGNIGDIAHSPGALRLFERLWPDAAMTLWPRGISPEARAGLMKAFPRLRIVEGDLGKDGRPNTPELTAAWSEADLLLHGSAPGFKGSAYLPAWRKASRKPYGLFGITNDPISGVTSPKPEGETLRTLRDAIDRLPAGHLKPGTLELLSGAAFVFCRETLTQHYFQRQGVRSPVLAFGPDSTFAMHLRDDQRAAAYLQDKQLLEGRFLCVIPRLRYTPRETAGVPESASGSNRAKAAINARHRERDHAKLRALIVAWVRETGLQVLACPEMSYEVALAKAELVDPLSDDVRRHVIWRDSYWMPDEAASIYARAAAVVSFECHSPILALANGTPAFYVRQPTDTIKGQMYHDIGASDWTFEVDETSGAELWSRLKLIHADPAKARTRVQTVMKVVTAAQRRMVDAARDAVKIGLHG